MVSAIVRNPKPLDMLGWVSIPVEVEESARLDGASAFRTFWSVVLPMARPAVITLTILSFQASWNELPHFIISRQSPS